MKPFFASPARQEALDREARSWKGTPYFANQCSKGHAVGCVDLHNAIWAAPTVAALPHLLELPRYVLDHGQHATDPQLIRFLLDHPALKGRLVFVPVNGRLLPGDLLGCRSGRTDHHLAQVILWDKVIHATETRGVIIHDIAEEKFLERVLYALRLMEVVT